MSYKKATKELQSAKSNNIPPFLSKYSNFIKDLEFKNTIKFSTPPKSKDELKARKSFLDEFKALSHSYSVTFLLIDYMIITSNKLIKFTFKVYAYNQININKNENNTRFKYAYYNISHSFSKF